MPGETATAICSMVMGGVLERFPRLKVCFAHGGGAFPYLVGRIEHGFNVRPDLCAVENPYNPRKYLGQLYTDSLVHDEKALKYLVSVVGEVRHIPLLPSHPRSVTSSFLPQDNVILGSDYPFPLGEHHPGKLIESIPEWDDGLKVGFRVG